MKNSLQAVLDSEKRKSRQPDTKNLETTHPPEISKRQRRPLSRENTKLIGGHFDPGVAKQLKMLAAEEDTTIQALLEQALDLLFVKKGKSKIMQD